MSGTNQIQKMNTSLSKKVMYSTAWSVKCNTLQQLKLSFFPFFTFQKKIILSVCEIKSTQNAFTLAVSRELIHAKFKNLLLAK